MPNNEMMSSAISNKDFDVDFDILFATAFRFDARFRFAMRLGQENPFSSLRKRPNPTKTFIY
jgi:hypothetical protein